MSACNHIKEKRRVQKEKEKRRRKTVREKKKKRRKERGASLTLETLLALREALGAGTTTADEAADVVVVPLTGDSSKLLQWHEHIRRRTRRKRKRKKCTLFSSSLRDRTPLLSV